MINAVWVHIGKYGRDGSSFPPFVDLYECSNCKAYSIKLFDKCPQCRLNMKKESEEKWKK